MKHIDIDNPSKDTLHTLYDQSKNTQIDPSYLLTAQVIAKQGQEDFMKQIEHKNASNDSSFYQEPVSFNEEKDKRNKTTLPKIENTSISHSDFKTYEQEEIQGLENVSPITQVMYTPLNTSFESRPNNYHNSLENIIHLDNYRPLRNQSAHYFYQITPFGQVFEGNHIDKSYNYNIKNYQRYLH